MELALLKIKNGPAFGRTERDGEMLAAVLSKAKRQGSLVDRTGIVRKLVAGCCHAHGVESDDAAVRLDTSDFVCNIKYIFFLGYFDPINVVLCNTFQGELMNVGATTTSLLDSSHLFTVLSIISVPVFSDSQVISPQTLFILVCNIFLIIGSKYPKLYFIFCLVLVTKSLIVLCRSQQLAGKLNESTPARTDP